jgi:hypothetical protein
MLTANVHRVMHFYCLLLIRRKIAFAFKVPCRLIFKLNFKNLFTLILIMIVSYRNKSF